MLTYRAALIALPVVVHMVGAYFLLRAWWEVRKSKYANPDWFLYFLLATVITTLDQENLLGDQSLIAGTVANCLFAMGSYVIYKNSVVSNEN